jgi:hypothetical protein
VYDNPEYISVINKIAEKIVPELKGSPRSFTKKTSKLPNNERVDGRSNLKMNKRIDTEIIFAKMKFLKLKLSAVLK